MRRLQQLAMDQFDEKRKLYLRDLAVIKLHIAALQEQIKQHYKKGDSAQAEVLGDKLADLEEEKANKPTPRLYYTSDSTIEKLAVLLTENPNGLLQHRDELMGWLRGMDKPGHEQDRPFYLETWEGDGAYVVNRIGRDTVRCDGMSLSVLGGTQPGPMSEYVGDSMRGGARDDGMIQRFGMAVWPDPLDERKYSDKKLDDATYNDAESVFKHLDELTAEDVEATIPDDGSLPYLRFDGPAQELFIDWYTQLITEKLVPDEHPAIESHLTKYESLMPSLALILHIEGYESRYGVGENSSFYCGVEVWCDDPRQSWYYGYSATHDYSQAGAPVTTGPIVNFTEFRG